MITIYHNPRCRKSRETLSILEEKSNDEIKVIEYLKDNPSKKDITKILKLLKLEPIDIVRKNEQPYKDFIKGKDIGNDKILDIIFEHPVLIERPIVIKGDRAVIGRPPENVNVLLD